MGANEERVVVHGGKANFLKKKKKSETLWEFLVFNHFFLTIMVSATSLIGPLGVGSATPLALSHPSFVLFFFFSFFFKYIFNF